jgi:hypothetical protein
MPGMPANLSKSLLYAIMKRMGEQRARLPELIDSADFLDLLSGIPLGDDEKILYVGRHLDHLIGEGYLREFGTSGISVKKIVKLTNLGEKFVQPELADFGQQELLPEVVGSLEKQILTYPAEKRDGFLLELREAMAKNSAELIAKIHWLKACPD